MTSADVRTSLFENGFDSCWNLQPGDLAVRRDSRPQLKGLIQDAEAFLSKVVVVEWLPEGRKSYLVPVKGNLREPDRLLHRYIGPENGADVEMVCGEFSVTLNVLIRRPSPVTTSQQALDFYRHWVHSVIRSGDVAITQLEAVKVGTYWRVARVFQEPSGSGEPPRERRTPWTWAESVRMAIDDEGRWLSVSVGRLPDRVDTMPKGGAGRSKGSWFDSYIASLPEPGLH